MERVDHVHVVEVDGRGFVCDIYGMLERQVPDGEGFEFRVARLHTVLMLVVELGEADCHFSAAGTGRGHDDEGAVGFYVIVSAVAVFADDERNI